MRKAVIGVLVFLVCLFAGHRQAGVPMAWAGTDVWTPKSDGLWGAWPNALAISPDGGTVYAGVQGGVYRSVNEGDSWEQILGRTVKALVINPQTPSTIYAGTESDGVYRSTNGGDNWEPINEGLTNLDVKALVINPQTPSTIYAGTNGGGVYRSENDGDNWEEINEGLTNLGVRALAINPVTPTTIYAGTGDGVYRSADGGDSWYQINARLINTDVWSLAINPETPTIIFVGTDDGCYRSNEGDEWDKILDVGVMVLAIDPQHPSTIYAGGGGLFKSTDDGDNWLRIFDIGASTLAINPSVPSTLYVGQWGNPNALFKSIDGGDNWTPTGLFAMSVLVLSINPSDPSIIYAGTPNDLFASTDRGDSWVRTGCGITHVRTIAIHPEFPDTIYTGGDMGGGVGYVYRSTDGGETWENITNEIITENIYALAINPVFPNIIYAGTEDGIYRSTDGGDTWEDITNGIHPDVRAIVINPDFPDIIYAGTDGGVFKSTDGGDSWEEKGLTDPGVMTLAINPAAPDIIYAGTRGIGVYRSTDNGDSWTQVRAGLPEYANVYSLAISSSGYIFVGIGSGVFMSTDNGESWINTGLTHTANTLAIDPQHPQTVYAGTWRGIYHFFYPYIVVSVGEDYINPGGKAHVPILVSDLTGFDVYSGEFSVFFDPLVLTFERATAGGVPGIQADYFTAHSPRPGRAELAFAGVGALEGEGVLAMLEFSVHPNAPVGYTTPVHLEGTFNEEKMNVLLRGGAVHVSAILVGDASRNGEVFAYDASLILQHVVGLIDLREKFPDEVMFLRVCDVTRNGTISALDASVILRFVVKLIPGLPYSAGKVLSDAGTSRTLFVSEGILEEGRVRVRIGLDDLMGVLAGTVRIGYDASRVQAVRAERAEALSGFLFESRASDGELRFSFAGAEASDGPGDLAEIAFEVLPGGDAADVMSSIRVLEVRLNEGQIPVSLSVRHEPTVPQTYALHQNFPNPFNPETTIRYALMRSGAVELAIYDANGQRVRTLVDGVQEMGEHAVVWDGKSDAAEEVASGVYFCRLYVEGFVDTKKLVFVR